MKVALDQSAETLQTSHAEIFVQDNVTEELECIQKAATVPMSMVSLTIPLDSLRRLPTGASYTGREGRTNVTVSRIAPTNTNPESIHVAAISDSVQVMCESYERTIRNLHIDYGEQLSGLKIQLEAASQEIEELKEKPPNAIGMSFKWLLYGILGGILITKIKNIISIIKKFTRL